MSLEAAEVSVPLSVDEELAEKGRDLFTNNCAECHGTYGANASYPSKLVSTQCHRHRSTVDSSFSKKYVEVYNQTWFAEEYAKVSGHRRDGYQAPSRSMASGRRPRISTMAHVPTLYDVLNSKRDPSFHTILCHRRSPYDTTKVGLGQ